MECFRVMRFTHDPVGHVIVDEETFSFIIIHAVLFVPISKVVP